MTYIFFVTSIVIITTIRKRPGSSLNIKMSYQNRDPMLKIRRSNDRLIFNTGDPYTGRTTSLFCIHLYTAMQYLMW